MKSLYAELTKYLEKRNSVTLATIVRADGSAPQVAGASALFTPRGLSSGTLGGGMLEAWAAKLALQALRTKRASLGEFDLRGEIGSGEQAVCGGRVTVLVDPASRKDSGAFRTLEAALARGRRGVLVTLIRTHAEGRLALKRRWVAEDAIRSATLPAGLRPWAADLKKALRNGTNFRVGAGSAVYAELQEPRPRLIIAGAGHIGRALARLASRLDFEVAVVDDRPEYANSRRLPEADKVVVGPIASSVAKLGRGRAPYIVIVTRGHSRDAEVLRVCVGEPAAYIGMIGSRRKVRLMRRAFLAERWATPRQFDRVSSPVGLDIKARTVEEIAVSIAAELILARRMRARGSVRRQPWFGP